MARSTAATGRARSSPKLLALLFAYVCIGAVFVVTMMAPASQPAQDEVPDAAHLFDPCQAEGSLLRSRHLSTGSFRKKHGMSSNDRPAHVACPCALHRTSGFKPRVAGMCVRRLSGNAATARVQSSMRGIGRRCGRRWHQSLVIRSALCSPTAGRRTRRGMVIRMRNGLAQAQRAPMWSWPCSAAPTGARLARYLSSVALMLYDARHKARHPVYVDIAAQYVTQRNDIRRMPTDDFP